MKEASRRTPYLRENYTHRHLVKLILSAVIGIIALGIQILIWLYTKLVFAILYPMLESEISLKTEIVNEILCLLTFTDMGCVISDLVL